MSVEDHFTEAYAQGSAPWDIGKPDFNLMQTVTSTPIAPCKALEIGCGTGDNALWLARRGFQVTAVDSAGLAIEKARGKALQADAACRFGVLDFLAGDVEGAPFGFVFDRGCFHTMDSAGQRRAFAEKVHRSLEENGLWLSLIGNADDEHAGEGPPTLTAREIADAVEPYFRILSLVASHFETHLPFQPQNWVCLMRRR